MNKKAVFAFIVLLIVLLVAGAAIVDAKSKGGGGRSSSSSSKGFSSALSPSSAKDTAARAAGISAIPLLAKSTKKTHLDADDLFENESLDNETADAQEAPKSPGSGALPLFLASSLLFVAWRRRHGP